MLCKMNGLAALLEFIEHEDRMKEMVVCEVALRYH